MIKLENPDEIFEWDTKELWNTIQLLEEDQIKTEKKDLTKIKEGVYIKIPIIYIIKEWIDEHPENKRVTIKGHGKYSITEYYDEIDERNKIMRNIILKYIGDEDPTKPRS